jgi:hypothetical protein
MLKKEPLIEIKIKKSNKIALLKDEAINNSNQPR